MNFIELPLLRRVDNYRLVRKSTEVKGSLSFALKYKAGSRQMVNVCLKFVSFPARFHFYR